ncbi:ras guanine nucleotide exchange factor domain-containing protein [Trichophaea hybrida]|nr:ras guanine nucleotide exchange factor domain-containing protein [Trichophaea hybrida]
MMDAMIWTITFTIGSLAFLEALTNHYIFVARKEGRLQESKRILKLVEYWVTNYPDDFTDPDDEFTLLEVYDRLVVAADKFCDDPELVDDVKYILYVHKQRAEDYDQYLVCYSRQLYTRRDIFIVHKSNPFSEFQKVTFPLDIDAELLAKYLSAAHLVLFRDICTKNTLQQMWGLDKYSIHPSIRGPGDMRPVKKPWQVPLARFAQFHQREQLLIHWVAVEVLQLDLEGRVAMIEKFIDTAGYLKDYGDLYGANSIVMGLSAAVIADLVLSWDCVSDCHKEHFEALKMDLGDDYPKTYLAASSPVIPALNKYREALKLIDNKKDHFLDRNRPNMPAKVHKSVLLEDIGFFDISQYHLPIPESEENGEETRLSRIELLRMELEGLSLPNLTMLPPCSEMLQPLPDETFPPENLDIYKWYLTMKELNNFAARAEGSYEFSKYMTRNLYVMRIYVPGLHVLPHLNPTPADEETGQEAVASLSVDKRGKFVGLGQVSNYVETRIVEAWTLTMNDSLDFGGTAERRTHTLTRLFQATEE